MFQFRKLILAVAAATSMASGIAHALGLGEVSVKSALNEPLVAEIELLDTKGLSVDEIRAQLASSEDFSRAGVERRLFLSNLKFTPVIKSNGKSFVRVISSQPVREPFLNFLMEVYWPAGRMMKEYTLLLDPPLYTPYAAEQALQDRAPSTSGRATVSRQPVSKATAQPKTRPAAATNSRARSAGDSYRVQKNDSLWKIALRVRRGGSVHQTMLAIQDLNPAAFINGNPNRIKRGYILKLPTAAQAQERSRSEAVAEFHYRSENLRSVKIAEPQQEVPRSEVAAAVVAPAPIQPKEAVQNQAAVDSREPEATSDAENVAKELNAQLNLAQEKLAAAKRDILELSEVVNALNGQVEKLQGLIESCQP